MEGKQLNLGSGFFSGVNLTPLERDALERALLSAVISVVDHPPPSTSLAATLLLNPILVIFPLVPLKYLFLCLHCHMETTVPYLLDIQYDYGNSFN